MSEKLDALFDLPANNEIENIRKALHEQNDKLDEQADAADEMSKELTPLAQQAMAQIDEREDRVNQLIDLKEFDADTDSIFNESMDAFREILSIARDLPAPSMGKALESAAIFAKIALDARNSKVKARLDAVDLGLKKRRIDVAEASKKPEEDKPTDATGSFLDRNTLLAQIKEELGADFVKDKNKPNDK
jgi:hypothetical protein